MDVLHRITKTYLRSVNEPLYPQAEWIWGPDLSAVVGFGSRYWIITGDVVTLMSPAERAAADAADLQANRDVAAAAIAQTENVLRAFMLVAMDEFNAHASKIKEILDSIDAATSLANLQTRIAAVADYPQRTDQQLRTAIRNKLGT